MSTIHNEFFSIDFVFNFYLWTLILLMTFKLNAVHALRAYWAIHGKMAPRDNVKNQKNFKKRRGDVDFNSEPRREIHHVPQGVSHETRMTNIFKLECAEILTERIHHYVTHASPRVFVNACTRSFALFNSKKRTQNPLEHIRSHSLSFSLVLPLTHSSQPQLSIVPEIGDRNEDLLRGNSE